MKENKIAPTNRMSTVVVPDSQLAPEVTQLIRDTESELVFNHSTRVYFWVAVLGRRKHLVFDPELLYVAAMFHDIAVRPARRTLQTNIKLRSVIVRLRGQTGGSR